MEGLIFVLLIVFGIVVVIQLNRLSDGIRLLSERSLEIYKLMARLGADASDSVGLELDRPKVSPKVKFPAAGEAVPPSVSPPSPEFHKVSAVVPPSPQPNPPPAAATAAPAPVVVVAPPAEKPVSVRQAEAFAADKAASVAAAMSAGAVTEKRGTIVVSAPPPPRRTPPPAPAFEPVYQPRKPSEFERRAQELLRKIWSWIVVGEEFRPKNIATEYSVATVWLVRGAMALILFGIAFFIKYSHDNNLIPPVFRLCIAVLTGVGMIALGCRLAFRRYHLSGIGLQGAGVVTLFFVVFAAHSIYGLIPGIAAYALMAVVTAAGCWLAVRFDALLIAVIASLGGYLTPLLLANAPVPTAVLLGYVLVLSTGMVAIAFFRNWKLLNIIAFLGAWVSFIGAQAGADRLAEYPVLITYGSLFFVLFSLQSILYNLGHKVKISLLELLQLILNAVVFLMVALPLTQSCFGIRSSSVVTLALTGFYVAQIAAFLYWKISDRILLMTMLVLAAFSLTLTFPLLLSGEWITTAWAMQALLMLFLGVRIRSGFLRSLALALYALTFFRLMHFDGGACFGSGAPGEYWALFIGRLLSLGSVTASLWGGAWVMRRYADRRLAAGPLAAQDGNGLGAMDELDTGRVLGEVLLWFGAVMAVGYGLLESVRFSDYAYPALSPLLCCFVLLGGIAFVFSQWRRHGRADGLLQLALVCSFLVTVYVIAANLIAGRIGCGFDGYRVLDGGLRLTQFLPFALVFAWWGRRIGEEAPAQKALGNFFCWEGGIVWFLYSSLELYRFIAWCLPGFECGAVSVLWGIYAFTLVACGLRFKGRVLRLLGLILFVVTAAKVLLIDLGELATVYRIIALILIGLAMLAGAFFYMRSRENFEKE